MTDTQTQIGITSPEERRRLLLLLLEKSPDDWSDDELECIRKKAHLLRALLDQATLALLGLVAEVQFRARKNELAQYPTSVLHELHKEAREFALGVDAAIADSLDPDTDYGKMPKYADINVIRAILKERAEALAP